MAALSGISALAVPITVQVGPGGGNGITENVLFDNAVNGPLVVGNFNSDPSVVVNFTSAGGDLTAPSNGQARVEGFNGNVYNDLSFGLANGDTFTQAIFNALSASNDEGTIKLTVTYGNASGSPFVDTYFFDNKGENWFKIFAADGAQIISVNLSSSDSIFNDVRQIRMGGFNTTTVPDGGTTLALLGLGSLALGLMRRKA